MLHIENAILQALSTYGEMNITELSKIIGFSNHGALQAFLERLLQQRRVKFEEIGNGLARVYVWRMNHDYYGS